MLREGRGRICQSPATPPVRRRRCALRIFAPRAIQHMAVLKFSSPGLNTRGFGEIGEASIRARKDPNMRKLFIRTALVAGAALTVSACNRHPIVNNVTTNDLGANMTMSAPGNDASAVESVSNNVQPAPASNSAGNTTRDTGAGSSTNNVESNTVGM